MKIVIVSDAWLPQVNGVVRTLRTLRRELRSMGHSVLVISPSLFQTVPCPGYNEIRLSVNAPFRLAAMLDRLDFDAIHIATEGPLGWFARRWCIRREIRFTTAWHTAFPEYVERRTPVRADWIYPLFRKFHSASSGVMVATPLVASRLGERGFGNILDWGRGVDTRQFRPGQENPFAHLAGPVLLYVGRVAVEKNLEAFLSAEVEGTKVVVGDGPDRAALEQKFPRAVFTGYRRGRELASCYSGADVFVFPSRTDTFGLVMLEALACGTPVAACPVQGPVDVIGKNGRGTRGYLRQQIGCLDENLTVAITNALKASPLDCVAYAGLFSWQAVARQFVENLALAVPDPVVAVAE